MNAAKLKRNENQISAVLGPIRGSAVGINWYPFFSQWN